MKRWITVSLMLAVLVVAAQGVTIPKGSKELSIEGLFDGSDVDGDRTDVTFFYGEFPEDNLEMGLQFRVIDTDHTRQVRGGMRVEMTKPNFEVAPYAAITLEYATFEIDFPASPVVLAADGTEVQPTTRASDQNRDDDAIVVGGHAGLKWFIAENIAVSGAFVYEWATEPIYVTNDGEVEDSDISLRFGMRFFF